MKRVLIILVLLVIVPMAAFAQHVREEKGSVNIYFRAGATVIDEDYKNNGVSLRKFVETINTYKADTSAQIGVISIVSSTSPEGTMAQNDYIGKQRAQVIIDWLKVHASVELSYKVESTKTDWKMLVAEIENRSDIPYKQELLDIIHNTPEFENVNGRVVESRLEKLKSFRNGDPYNWLYQNIFPKMRYTIAQTTITWVLQRELTITSASPMNFPYVGGSDTIKFEKSLADGVAPTVKCDAEWIGSIKATESGVDFVVAENPAHEPRTSTIILSYGDKEYPVVVNQEAAPTPESAPVVKAEPTPELAPAPAPITKEKKPFYMAIKTNLLYDAVAVPNLGVEFDLGKRFSLAANYTHAWWKNDSKNFYWRYYGAEASFRWWFGKSSRVKPLQGHHVGVNYQIMTYDFQLGNKGILAGKPGGTLIDRPTHTVALEYGYSLPVARRLNIDFVVGAGYNWGIFDEYLPIDGHYVWQSTKRRQYFGPTKIEVSLSWLIGHGNYNQKYNKKNKEAKR